MDQETTPIRIFSTASRVLLVFVTYALLLVATASLVSTAGLVAAPAAPEPGPEPLRGLPIVALASAGLVSWFVLRSRWLGAKLASAVALTFFGVHTVLPELEALAAPGSFSRAESGAAGSWFGGAVFAATFAVAAVVILGRAGRTEPRLERDAARLTLFFDAVKVSAAAGSYAIVHTALGYRWGWSMAPEGLASGMTLVRGALWALMGLALVRLLRRGAAETSVAVGLFFALGPSAAQLLPSPLLPAAWASRQDWALAASQLATGAALALWFSWKGPRFLAPRRGRGTGPTSLGSASRDRGWLHRVTRMESKS